MAILVLNAGSSSLRFALFNTKLERLYKGHVDAIGQKHCQYRRYFDDDSEKRNRIKANNHEQAIRYALNRLLEDGAIKDLKNIKKVGHRVVHGGEDYTKTTQLTESVMKKLKKLSKLAPLHNPANLEAVSASKRLLSGAKHYAIFDTAFHSTLPRKSYLYGLPYKLYQKEGIRRYGFHGTSHEYVGREAAKILKKKAAKLITCHLGNGISVTAIQSGKSVDTSMGFTPLEGPMMGTRSGTIDPAIIFHLTNSRRPLERVHQMLEHESGFKGMSGIGSDIRKLWAKPKSEGTVRTFEIFSYQMAKTIMSYFAPLGGLPDAIVFTAGIGEHAWYIRKQICDYLKPFGVKLNHTANLEDRTIISSQGSSINIFVIKTNEELEIARRVLLT